MEIINNVTTEGKIITQSNYTRLGQIVFTSWTGSPCLSNLTVAIFKIKYK